MADKLTSQQRSYLMSRVKGKNTKIEKRVRSLLHRSGYRFRLHRRDLPGSPDIVLPKYKIVIFVHGCFWHHHKDCKKAGLPKRNVDFWREKMIKNVERDERKKKELDRLGWKVVILWQCHIENRDETELMKAIERKIEKPD